MGIYAITEPLKNVIFMNDKVGLILDFWDEYMHLSLNKMLSFL